MTLHEVAKALGVSYWTIRRVVERGELRRVLVSKRCVRVSADEVLRYVETCAGVRTSSSASSRSEPQERA